MQTRLHRCTGAGFLGGPALLLVLLSSPCFAADGDNKPAGDAPALRRELDGHNFIPSRFTLDLFVSTYAAAETGFGYGTATGQTFDINGNPVSLADYKVGAFAQYLDFQYGFVDWWAVRLSVRILVYSGLNGSALASVGSTIEANPSLGMTMSFKVGEKLRLGGSIDVSYGPAVFFNIIDAVRQSISSGEITGPVNSVSQFTFKPAFVGAWAINKALGMTFSLNYQYTNASSDTSGINANLLAANATFDFDMNELHWAAIGLIGGFTTQFSVANTSFLSFRYNFGIFYTGVKPLNVGFEIVYNRAPIIGNTEVFLSSLIGLLVIQYNFN